MQEQGLQVSDLTQSEREGMEAAIQRCEPVPADTPVEQRARLRVTFDAGWLAAREFYARVPENLAAVNARLEATVTRLRGSDEALKRLISDVHEALRHIGLDAKPERQLLLDAVSRARAALAATQHPEPEPHTWGNKDPDIDDEPPAPSRPAPTEEMVEAGAKAAEPFTTRIVRNDEGGAIVVGKHTTPQELARAVLTAALQEPE